MYDKLLKAERVFISLGLTMFALMVIGCYIWTGNPVLTNSWIWLESMRITFIVGVVVCPIAILCLPVIFLSLNKKHNN